MMYTSPRLEICGLSIGSGYHDGDGRVHRRRQSIARHAGPSQRGSQRRPPSTIMRLMYCLATLHSVAKDDVRRCHHRPPHSECILAIRAQADRRDLGRQPPMPTSVPAPSSSQSDTCAEEAMWRQWAAAVSAELGVLIALATRRTKASYAFAGTGDLPSRTPKTR